MTTQLGVRDDPAHTSRSWGQTLTKMQDAVHLGWPLHQVFSPDTHTSGSGRCSRSWWRTLQMRSSMGPQIWPILPPSLTLISPLTMHIHNFPPNCRRYLGFSTKNTRFFPFSFSAESFFFHFWTAERHGAVTSPIAECFPPIAEHPVPCQQGQAARACVTVPHVAPSPVMSSRAPANASEQRLTAMPRFFKCFKETLMGK